MDKRTVLTNYGNIDVCDGNSSLRKFMGEVKNFGTAHLCSAINEIGGEFTNYGTLYLGEEVRVSGHSVNKGDIVYEREGAKLREEEGGSVEGCQ